MTPSMLDLRVHLEPIVRLCDDRVVARELLLRPAGGGDLTSHAARAQITMAWVTGFALRSAAGVLDDGAVPLHVNVTPADLSCTDFAASVAQTIGEHRLPRLVLEVTEQTELVGTPAAQRTLVELRERGVRFAIDDFGDGWAGLTSTGVVRPEIIKVRLALLRDRATVSTLRRLADDLGAAIVVEQVETTGHLQAVRDLGFPQAQGWYWDLGRGGASADPESASAQTGAS